MNRRRKEKESLMPVYTVKSGDTLDSIALSFQMDPLGLAYDNQIPYPYSLTEGEALYIREELNTQNTFSNTDDDQDVQNAFFNTGEDRNAQNNSSNNRNVSEASSANSDQIKIRRSTVYRAGGYAYPYISRYVLDQTLPYLNELYIFSYGFTTEGDLIAPKLPDDWMISLAGEYNTSPILTLTPFGPDGRFNNYLISQIVNREEARSNLINQILNRIREAGYKGVDVDFEYILAEDRKGFTNFVNELAAAVHELDPEYKVSVALAPKTSADQQGLLYEGKDYPALGEAADYVLLMTYEWGYTYGPPMAVAPIRNVRQVVDYAITEIPPEKINLGIPNYGYDWTLPYVRGESKAMTLGSIEARQRAVQYGVPILFDQEARSPYYNYSAGSRDHEVWFEDVRSLEAKFDLIREYGLRGAGYWNIMNLFRANWLLWKESMAPSG